MRKFFRIEMLEGRGTREPTRLMDKTPRNRPAFKKRAKDQLALKKKFLSKTTEAQIRK